MKKINSMDRNAYIDILKRTVWDKAMGTEMIDVERSTIVKKRILKDSDQTFDKQTIRKLLSGKTNFADSTLDKFSVYVLGDKEATFLNFIEHYDSKYQDNNISFQSVEEDKEADKFKDKKEVSDFQFEKSTENKTVKSKHRVIELIALSVLLGLIVVFVVLTFFSRYLSLDTSSSYIYEQDFNGITFSDLEKDGFSLYYPDTNFISLEQNMLKTHTLAGDIWTNSKFNEEPHINNLLIKKIACDQCEISIVIRNFKPYMPWQQAGMVLFDSKDNDDYDIYRFVRYTYAYGGANNVEEDENFWEVLQTVEQVDSTQIPASEEFQIRYNSHDRPRSDIHEELHLKIRVTEEKYKFFWTIHDSHGYKQVAEMSRIVEPEYIGIVAFSGMSNSSGDPLNADTISVFFDNIRILDLD